MIRSTNISTNDFTWSTEFNISHNRNEVVALGPDKDFEYTFRPGLGNHPYTWLKVGEPVGAFYGYIMDGIYRTREVANLMLLSDKKSIGILIMMVLLP